MTLSKKKEKELMQVYEAYWAEYLNGNVDAMQALLDDSYTQIGSAESEVFSSKKEAVQFLVDTIDQVAGKLEMRNRSTKLEQQDHLILIHEVCDLYALADKKWIFYSKFRASTLLQEKKEGWKITHQHSSFPDTKTEEGQNVAIDKIAEENKELREAVKRRTVELEHKNRELQIEAALERVRARAIAMQKSEELADLSFELVKQVQALGVPTWFCAFNIYDDDPKGSIEWGSNGEGVFPNYRTPRKGIFLRYYKAGQSGESLLINEIGEKDCPGHYEYLCTLPGVGEQLHKMKEAGIPFPTSQIDHVAFFKYGYILFITFEPAPESQEVFKRFAKVFEQAYQRFLDIKKAEVQTREARIEAALERVRARAMAMHKSEELAEAAELLYLQLKDLGIDPWTCGYVFLDEENNEARVWMVQPNGKFFWGFWTVPMSEEKVLKERHENWKKKENIHRKLLKGQENIDHHRYIVEHSPIPPDEAKDFLSTLPIDLMFTSLHFSHGYLMVISESFLSEEEENVLLRFTQVFELTYTRFLDLQKAEAQTREAQIEAAMERIRSRAIAMRTSNELLEVALEIRIQTDLLGQQDLELSVVHLYEKDAEYFESLAAMRTPGSEGKITTHKMKFPVDATPEIQQMMKNYWAGLSQYTIELNLKQRETWQKVLKTTVPDLFDQRLQFDEDEIIAEKKEYWNFTDFSGGSLLTVTYSPPTTETKELFRRAADVFDLAYKRFKDLKNAEKQAREAQIEAALERVRSRSMAMHKSEELKDVIQVVYDQFVNLNIHTEHTGFIIDYKENDDMHIWLADKNEVATEVIIPYFDCAHWNSFNDAKKNGENFFANHLTFEEKNKFYKDLFKQTPDLPENLLEIYLNYPGLAISTVLLENVGLYIENFDGIPYSDEENDTLMRFGKVFQQTYTRFLDLQKAEAQAREAQIEAAMERIRSRAIAMRTSDELLEVALEIRIQTDLLGQQDLEASVVHLYEKDEAFFESLVAMRTPGNEGEIITHRIKFPVNATKEIKQMMKNYWSSLSEYTIEINQKMRDAWQKVLLKHAPELFSQRLQFDDNEIAADQKEYWNFADFSGGSLLTVTYSPPSQETKELFKRSADVFDLAYRRYKDLKKAEAQAREAQIEVALERVRGRTMAMHDSNELREVVGEFFRQAQQLGFEVEMFVIFIFKPNGGLEWWGTEFGEEGLPQSYDIPPLEEFKSYPRGQNLIDLRKGRKPYEVFELVGKECTIWTKILLEKTGLKQLPARIKRRMKSVDKIVLSDAVCKYGIIEVAGPVVLSEENAEILQRFAKVFEQTYTRFLDVQKAEAQAREAQIETALERVRSRTMAMQKSEELLDAAEILSAELVNLAIPHFMSGFVLVNETAEKQGVHMGVPGQGRQAKFYLPLKGDAVLKKRYKSWKNAEPIFYQLVKGEKLAAHMAYVTQHFGSDEMVERGRKIPDPVIFYCGNFKEGYLHILSEVYLNEEQESILARFTKIFQQTYTRFLDLKKAEAQAREAQIEGALERVRSKTMAMHNSQDLEDIVVSLFDEVMKLGLDKSLRCGIGILEDHEGMETRSVNSNSDGTVELRVGMLDMTIHPMLVGLKKAWKNGSNGYSYEYTGKDVRKYYEALNNEPEYPFNANLETLPEQEFHRSFFFSSGIIFAFSKNPISEESSKILARFAAVFGQTYRRFLDLQKAEAQAREAQIEAALERVRSRSMAMHKSKEMLAVIAVVSEQLQQLNLNFDTVSFAKNNQEGDFTFWLTSRGQPKPLLMEVPTFDSPVLKGIYKAQKKGIKFLADIFSAEVNREWHEHLIKYSDLKLFPDKIKDFILNAPGFARSSFLLKNIDLYVGNYRAIPFTDEENSIFKRFAHVFEQSYTRFLDLQKAEAQARESQIEAALEKVRSRTMAMQKGEEVKDVVVLLYKELIALGVDNFVTCGYVEINEKINRQLTWVTSPGGDSLGLFYLPLTGDATFDERYAAWKKQQIIFRQKVAGEVRSKHLEYAITTFNSKEAEEMVLGQFPDPCVFYCFNFSHGYLHLVTGSKLKEEEESLLARFTRVFEQTYARFLDLKKAEAQAKEAQIENALEKVRSRTMAMQKSEELPEAANDLFLQIQALGIPAWSAGYCIWETEDRKMASCNMSSEGEIQKSFILPTIGEGYNFYDPLQKGESFYVEELGGDALVKHYDFMRTLPTVGQILDELINAGLSLPTFQIFHIVYFQYGYLMFITYEQVPDTHEIFKRFAKVFEQTYTRFLDLKKAEAQAREATKQASLDRVRGQIASMRSTADLERITPLVWNELTTMDVPFFRCGIFIMREEEKMVHAYLSTPSGNRLAAFHIGFDDTEVGLIQPAITNWKKQEIYSEEWNQERFIQNMDTFMKRGFIMNPKKYQTGETPPERLILQLVPFKQGMLYVGNSEPLIPEHIELMKDLAKAFSGAYSRYEDFNELEQAKSKIEATLADLKSTQNQLVHSEKMASLGELTAGIAHEIQNPLNFVNNFSEVSNELIDEMNEEIEKGDLEEAKTIADDIKQNLEKINHHGKRADAIVKGMLQHSRSSGGVKEPTDINALSDEYLRLAYHGLRAKDNSFNAAMKTDFEENIGDINIIPQDIGRVVLNLITNAFYATNEKSSSAKTSGDTKYEPTIAISTKKEGDKVFVSIKDNGNGIPKKMLDKIFQPFFTTKPTGQGTGLGLSLSYDIIKAHKGEISVKSKVSEGTIFTIALPA